MTWFVIAFPLVTLACVALLLLLMPSITRQTLPLGVSIPQERVGETVVTASVRRYRAGVLGSFVTAVILTLLLVSTAPVAAVIVPLFVFLLLSFGAYWLCRARIQRAKRDHNWYQDVPVRLSSTLTATGAAQRVSTPIGWYIAGVVILAAVAAVGVGRYDALPSPLPIHWNSAGVADGFATKSVWSVFGTLLIGIGMLSFLYLFARLTSRIPMRRVADYTVEQQTSIQQLMQSMIGQIAFVLALILSAISLHGWLAPEATGWAVAISILTPVLIFALIGVFVVRQRRVVLQVSVTAAGMVPQSGTPTRADSPDDDRYWKAGAFYLNRDDPALWVPKRFGVGWTVNLGHPAGIAILAIPVLIVVGVLMFGPGGVRLG
ncbi:DUF1648 domain-containing protein [Glaciibacter psychrotolerans]|uniref:Putative membrane protein n=1 Tax=Glaciibacter psychrotolerans TaxID=670054 RepID=A0A7Z0EDW9_9MICO|nr:DUF5808 domain-containing protein [Leifsonia psychrotolerans]NYJ19863.1 putative membrane protein [Leifsonia psychrotolerans]